MDTVDAVDTALFGIPTEEALDDATQTFDELELIVVEIQGGSTTGLGFTYTIGEGGTAIRAFIEDTLAPVLVGTSAAPRNARDRLREATTFVGREGIAELGIAALDIGLWDGLGKSRGLPLYELLGSEQQAIPAYQTHGGWLQYEQDQLVENAADASRRGFAGFKMKVGRGHAEDADRVRAVGETLLDRMTLLLDANCAYTVPAARQLARQLDVPVGWLEEPLEKGDYAGHADLRGQIDIPIAVGENLYNEDQFKQVVSAQAADILQPDVCRVGGISAWLRVAELAAAWDLPVSPHYIEPLHSHLVMPFDNVPFIEHHSTVLDSVLADPPTLDDGSFRPKDAPGHGMAFSGLSQYRKA